MTDMKTTFLGLLLLTATAISAQEQATHSNWQTPPATARKQVTDMTLHPLPKKGAKHLSSFLSVYRTVTTK